MNASETHAAVQTAIVPARLSANGTHRSSDELPVAAMAAPERQRPLAARRVRMRVAPLFSRVRKGAELRLRLEEALWAPSESSVCERALKLFSGGRLALYAYGCNSSWEACVAAAARLALRERSRHHFEFAVSALNFLRSPPFDASSTDREKRSTRGTPPKSGVHSALRLRRFCRENFRVHSTVRVDKLYGALLPLPVGSRSR